MAKIHLNKLKKKYGYHGEKLRSLMNKIIANNSENVNKTVARLSKANWTKSLQRISTKKKQFIPPKPEKLIPKRNDIIRKATIQGKLITDNLRDKLNHNLRKTLKEFKTKTGESAYIRRRGVKAGTINPKAIKQFEQTIKKTFMNYVKRDRRLAMPKNIHTIAVTETRSVINDMKYKFAERVEKENPELKTYKQWIHNRMLSKIPRKGHRRANGRTVLMGTKFKIANEVGTFDYMDHPHDPEASADQVINCNCDFKVFAKKIKGKRIGKDLTEIINILKSLSIDKKIFENIFDKKEK